MLQGSSRQPPSCRQPASSLLAHPGGQHESSAQSQACVSAPPIQSGGTTTSAHNTTRLTTHRFIAPVILDHDHQRINLRKCNDPVTRVPLAITPKSPKRPPFLYRLSRGMPPTTTRLSDHATIEPMAKVLPQWRALVLRIQRTAGELSVSEEASRLFMKWRGLYRLTSLGEKLDNVDFGNDSAHLAIFYDNSHFILVEHTLHFRQ